MNPSIKALLIVLICGVTGCSTSGESSNENEMGTNAQAILSYAVTPIENEEAVTAIIIQGHPSYSDQVTCTGTLISPKHILTAAHCVAELSDKLSLDEENPEDPACKWQASYVSSGATNLLPYMKVLIGKHLDAKKRNIYDIKSVTYHSGYRYFSESLSCLEQHYSGYEMNQNDIAIITLNESVPSDVAKPFRILPPWLGITKDSLSEIHMTFVGYGTSDDGRKGIQHNVMLKIDDYCSKAGEDGKRYCRYGQSVHIHGCHPSRATCRKMGEQDYYDEKVVMPAGSFLYLQSSGGPCSGDSGGPALLVKGKRTYVVGVTSYGDSICRGYGVSTAVQDYYDWIVANAPEAFDKANYSEICNNRLDDDGNGLIDQEDPVCAGQPYCGNGIVDGDESCDGDVFWNDLENCSDWNLAYVSGKVSCNNDCLVGYTECVEAEKPSTCGNGQLDEEEQCDGDILVDMYKQPMETDDCKEFSAYFSVGKISCNDNCMVNTENCISAEVTKIPVCGDGMVEGEEVCDGDIFADDISDECTEWDSRYTGGKVKCTKNCTLSFIGCLEIEYCGNGRVEGQEYCDGSTFILPDKSCYEWSHQYASGSMKCTQNCMPDYSQCVLIDEAMDLCGNGKIDTVLDSVSGKEMTEDCDGDVFLESDECSELDSKFSSGKVTCHANCSLDFGKCVLANEENEQEVLDESRKNTLESVEKPNVRVKEKSGDSVTFESDASNLQENLIFEDLSGNPIDDPKDPDEPDPGDDDPKEPDPNKTDPDEPDPNENQLDEPDPNENQPDDPGLNENTPDEPNPSENAPENPGSNPDQPNATDPNPSEDPGALSDDDSKRSGSCMSMPLRNAQNHGWPLLALFLSGLCLIRSRRFR